MYHNRLKDSISGKGYSFLFVTHLLISSSLHHYVATPDIFSDD